MVETYEELVRAKRWAEVVILKYQKEIEQLKEELDIYKIAQIGHDKIIMDYPFLKQKLEMIKDKADMWDGKESSYYGNKLKEILESK